MKNEKLLSEIAQERIFKLVELAKSRTIKMGSPDELAKRYIKIAKDMKSHYGIREANSINKILCKKCGLLLVPGMNARVRLSSTNNYRAVVCSRCGAEKHLFYK